MNVRNEGTGLQSPAIGLTADVNSLFRSSMLIAISRSASSCQGVHPQLQVGGVTLPLNFTSRVFPV
jgi:hypothetical protein